MVNWRSNKCTAAEIMAQLRIAKAAALIARKRKTVRRKTAQLIEMRQQRHHHHHADQRVGGRQDRGQRGSPNQISGIDSGMYMPKVVMLID